MMRTIGGSLAVVVWLGMGLGIGLSWARAGDLVVTIEGEDLPALSVVGAVQRFDGDGMLRVPVDPRAGVDSPRVDATAEPAGQGRYVFRNLPPGRYDLVLVAAEARVRVEGYHYPPITEFDPVWPADALAPGGDDRDTIAKDIRASRHYENKVEPLAMATDEAGQDVRLLMQLVRDLPTSYDAEAGHQVATVRHEFWQYRHRYGTWTKDRRTVVIDRVLLPAAEWRRWTWVWSPRLGGIEVAAGQGSQAEAAVTVAWPTAANEADFAGWWAGGP